MHEGPLTHGDDLLALLEGVPASAAAVAVMRHSVRGPVTDLRTSPDVLLTAEGEAAARRLGQRLAPSRPVRLGHSPIERCAQTARGVAQGFGLAGGAIEWTGAIEALGAPYVLDFERLVEASEAHDTRSFVRAWFDGALAPGIIVEGRQAARGQLAVALEHLESSPAGGLTLLVSHDWNVMLLREHYLGVRHDDAGWLDYLDGVLLVGDPEGPELRWRTLARRVDGRPCP